MGDGKRIAKTPDVGRIPTVGTRDVAISHHRENRRGRAPLAIDDRSRPESYRDSRIYTVSEPFASDVGLGLAVVEIHDLVVVAYLVNLAT